MSVIREVKDVDLSRLNEYSVELAKKVYKSGYVPEHILYVERAGLFVAYGIAKYFNCGISGIYATRSGVGLKSKTKSILKYLPRSITHILRNIELVSNIHAAKKGRNVHIKGEYPPKDKKLLIVDDAIDTGYSLQSVINFLNAKGYEGHRSKIAVLTTTRDDPMCRADIFLFDRVVLAFPWSFDSNEYKKAWQLYRKIRSSISSGKWKLQENKIE